MGVDKFQGNLRSTPFFGKWMKQIQCLFVDEDKRVTSEIVKRQQLYHFNGGMIF